MASSAPTVPGTDTAPVATPGPRWRHGSAVLLAVAVPRCWPRPWPPAGAGRRDTPPGTPQPVPDRLAASIEQAQDRLRRLPDDARHVGRARLRLRRAGPGQRQPRLLRAGPGRAGARRWRWRPPATPPPRSGWARWPTPGTTSPPPASHAEQALALNPLQRRGQRRCWPTRPPSSATPRPPPPRCSACWTCGPALAALHPRVLRAGAARPRRRGAGGAAARARRGAIGRDELAFGPTTSASWPGAAATRRTARAQYERGLAADPGDPTLLQGRAKVRPPRAGPTRRSTAYQR